jgi:hypothetical protein
MIALDGEGSVVSMTRRAEVFPRRSDTLSLVHRRLEAANPSQAGPLERMVRSAALTGAGRGTASRVASGGAMRLHRGPRRPPLTLTVTPFHSSDVLTEHHPGALVFVSEPAERPASRAALLSNLHGLTAAECRLADLLLVELELRGERAHAHHQG